MLHHLTIKDVFRQYLLFLLLSFFLFNGLSLNAENCLTVAEGAPKKRPALQWVSLFDGKTLKGWKKTNFGGEGEVNVKKGEVIMDLGNDLTGIHTDRKLPKINYEVELESKRIEGNDFFCGLTFPVKKKSCSLILGGWGGTTVGLSSIDGADASENNTTQYHKFENKKWYKIRLRITEASIKVWLDEKIIIEQEIKGRKLSIRPEVDPSLPFGIACFQTTAGLKNIRIRKLTKKEIEKSKIVKKKTSPQKTTVPPTND
ncbi:hypothetical protein MNBD_PLANCTO02-1071 [hydrothermal vent metagenome]|uniref:3-keto-alpha-glucoside-1,2-lyase/3-keto-2-hydroxy-glucal hydratase domain-containing protein n=1 Tax=hydrothermal vent metagenome TaxID=652676 RepID=A0A3B1D672_9ZZZZ